MLEALAVSIRFLVLLGGTARGERRRAPKGTAAIERERHLLRRHALRLTPAATAATAATATAAIAAATTATI